VAGTASVAVAASVAGTGAVVGAVALVVILLDGAVALVLFDLLFNFFGRRRSSFFFLRSSMVDTLVTFLRLVITVLRTGSVSLTIPSLSSRAAISGVSSRILVISVVIQAISSELSGSNSAVISTLFKTVSRAAN
jgi:hypothetical protein